MELYVADKFIAEIDKIKEKYNTDKDVKKLKNSLTVFALKYKNYFGLGDYLINLGEEYIGKGDYNAGITLIKTVEKYFKNIADETTVYLRMAEYYLEKGKTQKGIDCLIKLCTETVDNYEEAIANRELTAVWERYKYLVEGKVPDSVAWQGARPLSPEECSLSIDKIFELSDDKLLAELSNHLQEMSAYGEHLNCLNKWEKTFFYVDELCMEINSGGFSHYLYYRGNHFEKACQALETIGAEKMIELLKIVENKFPRNKIPKNIDSIQNVLDKMEENGIDFESEEKEYYENVETKLLQRLTIYVNENKKRFR